MNMMHGVTAQLLVIVAAVGQAGLNVSITKPANGSKVDRRLIVEGTVNDPKAEVWVVVHPLGDANYFVQPRVSVRKVGTWKAQIYIGEPGLANVSQLFEVRAIANPKLALREDLLFEDWPEAASISEIVEVKRR